LHTPQVFPSFVQCLQYLQFLQALHGVEPVQVAIFGKKLNKPRQVNEIANNTTGI